MIDKTPEIVIIITMINGIASPNKSFNKPAKMPLVKSFAFRHLQSQLQESKIV